MFKNNYHKRHFFAMFQMMLMPFMGFMSLGLVGDEGGAGTSEGEAKLLAKVQKRIDEFKDSYTKIAEDAANGKMSKEDVDAELKKLETKSETFTNQELKKLKDEVDKVSESLKQANLKLKELKDGKMADKSTRKGFGDLLKEAMEKAGIIEEYVVDSTRGKKAFMMKGYDKKSTNYSLKAAIDMTTALSVRPGADPGTAIGYLTDYKMRNVMIDLTKDTHVVQFMPTDPIVDKYMGVLIESDYFDGSATKAEASASAKSSLKFSTKEFKVFTIATHFRVSKENLADIDRLVSKINRIAPDRIMSTFDGKVLSAAGDNSTDVEGMYVAGNYTAFVASTFASSVAGANLVDLIRKMRLQAYNADQDVNVVILHPTQVDEIEGLKDLDENYLKARGIVYDAMGNLVRVHGLAVIKNKKPTTSKVTVMWNEAAEIGIRDDISFEIGTDGNDLTEGMRTIVFDMRAAFGVGKASAIIVSTDPTADIATIDAGV